MRNLLVLAVLLAATTCLADSFKIDGTISIPYGPNVGTFTGTIDINTATGTIFNWDIKMPDLPGFSGFGAYTFTPSDSTLYFGSGYGQFTNYNDVFNLAFVIPNNTLIRFTGSSFYGYYYNVRSVYGANYLVSGTIILTPEPSSLVFMGSGLAGMIAFRRKLFSGS